MPVYRPLVPLSTDFIAQSQKDFRNNFIKMNDDWGKAPTDNENVGDHVPLVDGDTDLLGKHKKTTLVEQAADPTTAANEIALYSKNDGARTELFYREESDGDVVKMTDNGKLSPGAITLRAYVVFDASGNIIEVDGVDDEGEPIKVPISFNVTSVVEALLPLKGRADWNVTFTNAIPTADYFWILQAYNNNNTHSVVTPGQVNVQPRNAASYATTVTTTTFGIRGISTKGTDPTGAVGRTERVQLQIYTVAT